MLRSPGTENPSVSIAETERLLTDLESYINDPKFDNKTYLNKKKKITEKIFKLSGIKEKEKYLDQLYDIDMLQSPEKYTPYRKTRSDSVGSQPGDEPTEPTEPTLPTGLSKFKNKFMERFNSEKIRLENEKQKLEDEKVNLDNSIRELETEKSKINEKHESLQPKIEILETLNTQYTGEIENYENNIIKLNNEMKNSNSTRCKEFRGKNTCNGDISNIQSSIRLLETKKEENKKEIEQIKQLSIEIQTIEEELLEKYVEMERVDRNIWNIGVRIEMSLKERLEEWKKGMSENAEEAGEAMGDAVGEMKEKIAAARAEAEEERKEKEADELVKQLQADTAQYLQRKGGTPQIEELERIRAEKAAAEKAAAEKAAAEKAAAEKAEEQRIKQQHEEQMKTGEEAIKLAKKNKYMSRIARKAAEQERKGNPNSGRVIQQLGNLLRGSGKRKYKKTKKNRKPKSKRTKRTKKTKRIKKTKRKDTQKTKKINKTKKKKKSKRSKIKRK